MTDEQPKEVPQEAQAAEQKPRRGGRRGFGRGGRAQRRPRGQEEEEWVPCTNLGRLVKGDYIKSLEEIYYHSIPIKEPQIVDYLYKKAQVTLKEISSEANQGRTKNQIQGCCCSWRRKWTHRSWIQGR